MPRNLLGTTDGHWPMLCPHPTSLVGIKRDITSLLMHWSDISFVLKSSYWIEAQESRNVQVTLSEVLSSRNHEALLPSQRTPIYKQWRGVTTHETDMHTWVLNSSPPGQNGRHFADDIFRCNFVNEEFCILVKISLKFVPKGPIDNDQALV